MDTVLLLSQTIKQAWCNGKVVSALFLDIEGAFPNATTEQLLHNMKKRDLPCKLVRFAKLVLEGHKTSLCFDGFMSPPIHIDNGIGQGDPDSMPWFNLYNADLLNIDEHIFAFVDDMVLLAIGDDFRDTHRTLLVMMTQPGGALQWSREHNSPFEFSKFALWTSHETLHMPRNPHHLFSHMLP